MPLIPVKYWRQPFQGLACELQSTWITWRKWDIDHNGGPKYEKSGHWSRFHNFGPIMWTLWTILDPNMDIIMRETPWCSTFWSWLSRKGRLLVELILMSWAQPLVENIIHKCSHFYLEVHSGFKVFTNKQIHIFTSRYMWDSKFSNIHKWTHFYLEVHVGTRVFTTNLVGYSGPSLNLL